MSGKIEISRDLAQRLLNFTCNEEYDELRAPLAAPVVERQPVAYVLHKNGEIDWDQEVVISNTGGDEQDDRFEWRPVYAEQPAPVALLMPDRMTGDTASCIGWNACLDKFKEMNK